MMVIVDTGTWRSWLHFLVGVDNPEMLIDINKVFLLSKKAFDFKNEKELVDVLSKAGVLINKIMRIMEENRENGVTLTGCCPNPVPNRVLFSPIIDGT